MLQEHRDFEVAGEFVRAQSPLVLPSHRCVKCGSTETGGSIHNEVVNHVNPLVWLTFLISGLITIVAYFATRKRLQMQYYLCPKCDDKRRIKRVTTDIVTIISVTGLALTLVGGPFEVFLAAFLLSLMARLFWIRQPLHSVAHDEGWFSLAGASPKFLEAHEHKQLEG